MALEPSDAGLKLTGKIGYVLHRFPGITDTFIRREIRGLQKLGADVHVVSVWTPNDNQTTPANRAAWASDTSFALPRSTLGVVASLARTIWRDPAAFLTASRLAFATSKPGFRGGLYQLAYFMQAVLVAERLRLSRVTHAHNHIGDQSGTVTMLAACLNKIAFSITFHGWPVFFDARESRLKEKIAAAQFTRSISYFCRSQLMMFANTDDPSTFKIAHCGVALANYPFRPPRTEVKTLFCAARLSPEKGIAFTIQALKQLIDQGLDLNLRLAGDGPSKPRLEALAAELGLSARVAFLGSLTEAEVISELQACDLFVLSSSVEGIPVSAMEAMAIGVPVIATNIAGTAELVTPGQSGVLVRPSDPQALADAIAALIADPGQRLAMARAGRAEVEAEFDIEVETAKLHAFFAQAMAAPGQATIRTATALSSARTPAGSVANTSVRTSL